MQKSKGKNANNTQTNAQQLNFRGGVRPILLMIAVAMLAWASAVRAGSGQWVYNITGGGQDLYPGDTTPTFDIKFSAQENAAGDIFGQFLWTTPDGSLVSSGTVEDIYVNGNQVFIRYLQTAPNSGLYIYVGFEDNGQGSNSPDDRQTYIYGSYSPLSAEYFADFILSTTGFPVDWMHGNITLH